MLEIREATIADFERIWPIFQAIAAAGDTYAYPPDVSRDLGYEAMQFNFVASTNEGAIRLWRKLGFEIVGRVPGAFKHPAQGNVDALVMYKWLTARE